MAERRGKTGSGSHAVVPVVARGVYKNLDTPSPMDAFENVPFHAEILLFNMPKLEPHYFLPDRYLR